MHRESTVVGFSCKMRKKLRFRVDGSKRIRQEATETWEYAALFLPKND